MAEKVFHLQPWTLQVQTVAQKLIGEIRSITPELEVLFMGAAALGLPGKNDIDLDVLCDAREVGRYTRKLRTVLGSPKETNDSMTAWEFQLDGFEVDCMLSDPKISHVPLQRKRFEILKADQKLRDEYKKLKEACDGLPYNEYEKRKAVFLEGKVFSSKS
ncbi:MAG TPA: hypothetical protein VN778_03950 [Verrucomicrobiae bacterium]|nr:hypothetical protein [Verrucomicrobiae bacterium]